MPVRTIPIGENAYLWHKSDKIPPRTRCIITAHGMQFATWKLPMNLGRPDVFLRYYTKHNYKVTDQGLEYPLRRGPNNSENWVDQYTADSSPDYLLSKYTNSREGMSWRHRHNDNAETYAHVRTFVASGIASEFSDEADVITIRSRQGFAPLRLSTLLKDVWAAGFGYQIFDCYFCRGFISNPIKEIPAQA